MNIIVNKNKLITASRIAKKIIIGGEWSIPVLRCIKISIINNKEISILATDLENWVDIRVEAKCEKLGSTIVDLKAFLSALKTFSGQKIILQFDGVKCSISEIPIKGLFPKTSNKEIKLEAIKEEEWPIREFPIKKGSERKIKSKDFLKSLKSLRCSWDGDNGKVQINFGNKSTIVEAFSTNNHIIIKTLIPTKGKAFKFMLFPQTAEFILSFLEISQRDFQENEIILSEIEGNSNWFSLSFEKIIFYFQTKEILLNLQQAFSSFDKGYIEKVVFNKKEIIEACDFIISNTNTSNVFPTLIFTRKKESGIVEIQGNLEDGCEGKLQLSCGGSIKEFAFGVNPHYLKRVIENCVAKTQQIEIAIKEIEGSDEIFPIKIEESGTIYFIMLIRI